MFFYITGRMGHFANSHARLCFMDTDSEFKKTLPPRRLKKKKARKPYRFFLRFFYVLPTSAHPPRNGRSKYFVGRQPTYPFLSIFNGSTHDDALPCHVWFDFRLVQHWSGTTFIFKRSLYIQDELYSKFFLLIIMDSY